MAKSVVVVGTIGFQAVVCACFEQILDRVVRFSYVVPNFHVTPHKLSREYDL